jgi:hypothetical protein
MNQISSQDKPKARVHIQITLSGDVARLLKQIGEREGRNRSNTVEYLVVAEHRRRKEMA